jgi:thiol-disulfide isomerase/thioredoxin
MRDTNPEQPSPSNSRTNRYASYAVLAVAIAIAIGVGIYLFTSGGSDNNPAVEAPSPSSLVSTTPYPDTGPLDPARPAIGKPAPDFALVDARDPSKIVKLSDFKGKAVVVNWFASWCEPCKREMPEFEKLYKAIPGDVVILGVDYLEGQSNTLDILNQRGVTYPAVLDTNGDVADHYRVGVGLPTTFFVDKDGILRVQKVGEVKPADLEKDLKAVGISYTPPAEATAAASRTASP